MPASAEAALMGGDALAAMEHLDGAAGQAHVNLLADQRVRHRVEEALGLDMMVEVDPGQAPLGVLVSNGRSVGRSMLSKSSRRLTPRRRILWALMRSTAVAIAALH